MKSEKRPIAANDNPRYASEFGEDMAARRAWLATLPKTSPKPRKAKTTGKAKHSELSKKLRTLLTWRAMATPADWTNTPVIENLDQGDEEGGERENPNMDCLLEMRPLPSEIMAAIGDKVEFREIKESRIDGGGRVVIVAVGGDIDRYKTERQDGKKPDCVTRIGRLHFSNGANEQQGRRVPLGGLLKVGKRRPEERWGEAKGAANDNEPLTVDVSSRATPPAFDFVDPIEERQEAARVRSAVGKSTAAILDAAIVAANFSEIGERMGYTGKTAERRGKLAVIAACEILEKTLAA